MLLNLVPVSYTHLDVYKRQLQNFINAGGIGLVNIGVDHTYNTRGIVIASQAQQLFPHTIVKTTIWLHPYEVAIGNITTEHMYEKLNQLYELYKPSNKDHIIAIGEFGIDILHSNTEPVSYTHLVVNKRKVLQSENKH